MRTRCYKGKTAPIPGPQTYRQLRTLAHAMIGGARLDPVLQATALVHEAYLRLDRCYELVGMSPADYFRLAARAMKTVLVDHARARKTQKRRGWEALSAQEALTDTRSERALDLIMLDAVLSRLATLDPAQARLIELRFFGGLSEPEVASVLGVCRRTVHRQWDSARLWLYHEMMRGHDDDHPSRLACGQRAHRPGVGVGAAGQRRLSR